MWLFWGGFPVESTPANAPGKAAESRELLEIGGAMYSPFCGHWVSLKDALLQPWGVWIVSQHPMDRALLGFSEHLQPLRLLGSKNNN